MATPVGHGWIKTWLLGERPVIFVTVGTQLAFDRMVDMVDRWARLNPSIEIVAQVGPTTRLFSHLRCSQFLSPSEATKLMSTADVVVSHAGMGSILTALKHHRPIIIMARQAAQGEHRNDHQLATARWLKNRPGISVAEDEAGLHTLLDQRTQLLAESGLSDHADEKLLSNIRNFIVQP